MRMDVPDASSAARELNRARWGSQVPDRCGEVTVDRWDELSPAVRARLVERASAFAAAPGGEGDDAQ